MFSETTPYYDKIYAFKDYRSETQRLTTIIGQNLRSEGNRLLDVACGTGRHIEHLKASFVVEGLDLSQEMLDLARQRNPGVPFHCADMTHFDLGHGFDVVICLFSSIGYVKTVENLDRAIVCMARHLLPGGLLVIEPWFTPETYYPNTVHAVFIDEPNLKIARINTSAVEGRLSILNLHYLIGTPTGTEHLVERHELGLFETAEMRDIFAHAGLDVTYDPQGLTDRGLLIGQRPGR